MCSLSDGRLVCGSSDGTIRLWNLKTIVSELIFPEGFAVSALCDLLKDEVACGFANGSMEILTANNDGTFRRSALSGHVSAVSSLCRVGDTHLASGSVDLTIKVWRLEDGHCERIISTSQAVHALCSLGEGLLAGGLADKSIKIWNAKGLRKRTLSGHDGSISCLCFLGNGILASGSADKSVKIWNTTNGECLKTFTGHDGPVLSLCCLGPLSIVSGSSDKTIRKWDLKMGNCQATLSGHKDAVRSLCFLSDNRLASGSRDGLINIWNMSISSNVMTIKNFDPTSNGRNEMEPSKLQIDLIKDSEKDFCADKGKEKDSKICDASFQAAREGYRSLIRMVLSGQLRSVDSIKYPFKNRSGLYEIVLSVCPGGSLEAEKAVVQSLFAPVEGVKITFMTLLVRRQLEFVAESVIGKPFVTRGSPLETSDGSLGLVLKRKMNPQHTSLLAKELKDKLDFEQGDSDTRLAILTAAHVCTSPFIKLPFWHAVTNRQHISLTGRYSQDYSIVDIIMPPLSSPINNHNHRFNFIDSQYFSDHDGKLTFLGGHITKIGMDPWSLLSEDAIEKFQLSFCPPVAPRRVFFIGQTSRKRGLIKAISHSFKVCMIACEMRLEKGDAGGLLFCENEEGEGDQLIALGVLSMIDEAAEMAYFTALSACYDPDLFELP